MRTVGFFVGALCLLSYFSSSLVHAQPTFVCSGFENSPTPGGVAAKSLANASRVLPSRGQLHALVIFAQFQDEAPGVDTVPHFSAALFDPDRPGSFPHFYRTMSFNQLHIEGTVLPKRYTSDQPAEAYLVDDPNKKRRYGKFVREILKKVDADVDLSQFDNDGPDGVPNSGDDDGLVDYLFVLLRSVPDHFLLEKADGIAGLGFSDIGYRYFRTKDKNVQGQSIRFHGSGMYGSIMQEGTFAQTVGVMAHEFGHALGLPDLYDQNYRSPEEDSAGIGQWGLMGMGAHGWNPNDGPASLCAWSREQLGWIGRDNEQLIEIEPGNQPLPLDDLHEGGMVYKIMLFPDSTTETPTDQEYLLLERRTHHSHYYNRNLPAAGVLIWHIRHKAKNNNIEDYKLVDLVCADGMNRHSSYELESQTNADAAKDDLDFWAHNEEYRQAHDGNQGDATDPFDGVRFTHLSIAAGDTRLVMDIHRREASRELEMVLGQTSSFSTTEERPTAILSREEASAAQTQLLVNYPNPFNATTTIHYELRTAMPVHITIYNALGQEVKTLVASPQSAGRHQILWNGRDDNGHALASGLYLYRLQAGKWVETRQLMLLR